MKIVKLPIKDLHPNERNVRKHNRRQITEMIKAINAFGIIRPIVIDENNTILCGHGLHEALCENGAEYADCIIASGLTDKQKKKLMLADNKIYDLGTSDFEVIDKLLTEFGLESDFSVPGYDAEYLEDLYGIRSIEKEANKNLSAFPPNDNNTQSGDLFIDTEQPKIPVPSNHIKEEREKQMSAQRAIICPHCGGIVEL